MQVILLQTVNNVGKIGDIVDVKNGYARNFLIPKKMGKQATKNNLEEFEKIRAELEAKEAEIVAAASAEKDKIDGKSFTIIANAGPEGKLFGSVTSHEIADFLATEGYEVERKAIRMPEGPIRNVGDYELSVHFYTDVDATITVTVKGEQNEDEMPIDVEAMEAAEAEAAANAEAEVSADAGEE